MNGTLAQRVILALDNMEREEIIEMAPKFKGKVGVIKVGLELFCKYGPEIVHEIHEAFHTDIFLDLKLHDIPNTTAKAIKSLEGLPIRFLTIHLSGGLKMISSALSQAKESLPNTQLLGVSYLTSLGEDEFLQNWGVDKNEIPLQLERMFTLAIESKIHGLVCSAKDLEIVRKAEQKQKQSITTVCPGIRFLDQIESGDTQDQKRVMDPLSAIKAGASFLVVGRPLTQANEKLEARLNELKVNI